jgi:hypothetical protein
MLRIYVIAADIAAAGLLIFCCEFLARLRRGRQVGRKIAR